MWRFLLLWLLWLPLPARSDPGFTLIPRAGYSPGSNTPDILDRLRQNRSKVQDFLGTALKSDAIGVEVFPDLESKALATQDMQPAHVDIASRTLYLVQNDFWDGTARHAENHLLVVEALGKSPLLLLEKGLANWLVDDWQEKGWLYWAHRLAAGNSLPHITDLWDNARFQTGSPLIYECIAAAFVGFLLDTRGKQEFLRLYSTPEELLPRLNSFETAFNDYLLECFPSEKISKPIADGSYWKGFNFAHEGYRIYNGYGSQLAKRSLAQLVTTGSNAIAVVPYTFMRDPAQPTPLPFSRRAGGENDAAVLEASLQARKLGLKIMLKPQIWLRNSWPGAIQMTSEADWQLFFEYYQQWITHYALLAEMYELDALCIGVELVQSTTQHPDKWRKLIRNIRMLYSGPITYAANWGEEFENLNFWDDLDYIGLDCYYPLGGEKTNSSTAIRKAFRQVCQKIESISCQFNKPVILTEIGFRSVSTPWVNPHAEPMGRPISQEHQMLCYQAVLQEIQQQSWCTGMLWWKWPSYLDYGGETNAGFSPNNKMAEQILRQGFTQLPR